MTQIAEGVFNILTFKKYFLPFCNYVHTRDDLKVVQSDR